MNNQIQTPENPLADPTHKFIEWYKTLTVDQQLRISVDLLYAVPQFNTWFTGETADAPIVYLQGWTSNNYELLGRIGTLKTLIDVFLLVPSESEDVTAYYLALYTSMLSKAKAARRNEAEVQAVESAYQHAEQMRRDYDALYAPWVDLSVSNEQDSHGSASPFAARYLYRWMCQEDGRDDPFVAGEYKATK